MTRREVILWVVLIFVLVLNLFSSYVFTRTLHAQAQQVFPDIALSAGENGVIYFYDGVNLWFSNNYGKQWEKVK
ncbi:MAG TPA: hypothetical protein EYP78_06450 [Candidatus Omnitrophica bacterium]|nr:hypothetical protein [Candidatus Omnitrophota bacterium]